MTTTIPIFICVVSVSFIITFIVIFVLAFKKSKKKLEAKLKERRVRVFYDAAYKISVVKFVGASVTDYGSFRMIK